LEALLGTDKSTRDLLGPRRRRCWRRRPPSRADHRGTCCNRVRPAAGRSCSRRSNGMRRRARWQSGRRDCGRRSTYTLRSVDVGGLGSATGAEL